MTYNPNADLVYGLEWFPVRESARQVDSQTNVMGAILDSSAAETVRSLRLFLSSAVGAGGWEIEIYDASDADPDVTSSTRFAPHEDVSVAHMIGREIGMVVHDTDLWELIDEDPTADADDNDWAGSGFGAPFLTVYSARFGNGALDGGLTGAVVTGVKLRSNVQSFSGVPGYAPVLVARPFLDPNGTAYAGRDVAFPQSADYLEQEWLFNPATGVSWKLGEVYAFDSGAGSRGAGWFFLPSNSVNFSHRINQMYLEVAFGLAERRVAVGTLPSPPHIGWNSVPLRDLDGVIGDWAKADATTYLILLRRRSGTGQVSVRSLDSRSYMPNGWTSFRPAFQSDAQLGPGGVPDVPLTAAYGITLIRSDAAGSVDSQPYAALRGADLGHFGTDDADEIRQYFTTGAGGDYGAIQALCRVVADPTLDDLTVEIRLAADDSVEATQTFEAAELLSAPITSFQVANIGIEPAPTLAGGTEYYIAFFANLHTFAVDDLDQFTALPGWEVQVLSSERPTPGVLASGGDEATFTPGADGFWRAGPFDETDACVTIALVPDTPTGFTAEPITRTLDQETVACAVDEITTALLGWDAVDPGITVEIQRQTPSVPWVTIALITNDIQTTFEDVDPPLGQTSAYRIRARNDFAASPWTATLTVVIPQDIVWGVIFTGNEARDLSVAYAHLQTEDRLERSYHFPNADTDVVARLYNRDNQVVFAELEDRGDTFPLELLISGSADLPAATGRPVFDTPLAIMRAGVSSVTVKDGDGHVWYASVSATDARRMEQGSTYLLDVVVTEVADAPPVVSS